jgi:large subunit ribosomal protein L5
MNYIPRYKKFYKEKIIPFMMEKFSYNSIMEVPKLIKIVLSKGLSFALSDKKAINSSLKEITYISGQKSVLCYSKRDEAGFKLRKGMPIACKVTLRRDIMYEFLDRFLTIALPRTRDFRGLNINGFDGKGNYNVGIIENIIFPEIDIDKVKKITGMNVAFVTSSKNDEEAKFLLIEFGIPFKKKNGKRIFKS